MNISIGNFENFQRRVPAGDDHERYVCENCDWIHYDNPRIIATVLCIDDGKILFCRRAIRPRYGFWTLPGGFMELGETAEDAACREAQEEAGARVSVTALLGLYSIPRIGQVHLVYLAELTDPKIAAGIESLDLAMIEPSAIPWDELAFPVNHWALRDFLSLNGEQPTQPFSMTPERFLDRMLPLIVIRLYSPFNMMPAEIRVTLHRLRRNSVETATQLRVFGRDRKPDEIISADGTQESVGPAQRPRRPR